MSDDGAPSSSAGAATSASASVSSTEFLVPVGLDLASPELRSEAAAAVAAGIAALPALAEVYPLGGAGDRLGLRCETSGESLPTAVLQYCGRSLLENLLRDLQVRFLCCLAAAASVCLLARLPQLLLQLLNSLFNYLCIHPMPALPHLFTHLQAREYLFWKLQGVQHTTPVAIMTSAAKGNHWRVQQLFEQAAWFGRGPSSFRLFQQPLVPVVAGEDGRWLLERPLQLMMKPGGHGVIWKLMIDTGVFDWLGAQGRQAAIVRQIRCGGGGVWWAGG
jgi:hypothetical protein